MILQRILAGGAVAAVLACTAPAAQTSARVDLDAVEDSVWTVVLDSLYVRPDMKLLVVRGVADGTDRLSRESVASVPGIQPATVADFQQRNEIPRTVAPLAITRVPMRVVSAATLDSLEQGGPDENGTLPFWGAFEKRFPNSYGLVSLSRVGFNAEATQAVVNVDHGCGGLCGEGTIVMLGRDPSGRWRIVDRRGTWIS
jgi:hypothetical protein